MSRHEESMGRMPNPCEYFFEWNSERNSFCYYSKEKSELVPFPLPFRFLALKFVNTITGFNEHTKQGIYSNEITDTRREQLVVKYRDGSHIATGTYADIKEEVNAAGGRFTRSIYALSTKGKPINIRLRGGQMFNFGVIEKAGNRWKDEWIQIATVDTREHDGKPYTIPVFTFGGTLSDSDSKKADAAYDLIKAYFMGKAAQRQDYRPAPARTAAPAVTMPVAASTDLTPYSGNSDDDDLPF